MFSVPLPQLVSPSLPLQPPPLSLSEATHNSSTDLTGLGRARWRTTKFRSKSWKTPLVALGPSSVSVSVACVWRHVCLCVIWGQPPSSRSTKVKESLYQDILTTRQPRCLASKISSGRIHEVIHLLILQRTTYSYNGAWLSVEVLKATLSCRAS